MSRLLIALAIVVAGCTTSYDGELTALQCADESDNDGDLLPDCEDPDCQVYASCTVLRRAAQDGGRERDAGGRRDSGAPHVVHDGGSRSDAGTDAGVRPPPPNEDDAGAVPPEDAGAAVQCEPACGETEVCIDGSCQAAPPAMGAVVLTLTSVHVPNQDDIAKCYDDCTPVPFALCACQPDPFIVVTRVREGTETEVGRTAPAVDSVEASYTDMPMTIEVLPTDLLRAKSVDDDEILDTPMYTCDLPQPLPSRGPVTCVHKLRGVSIYTVEAQISAP